MAIKMGSPSTWKQSANDSVGKITAWASSAGEAVTGKSGSDVNEHQEVEQLRQLDGDRFRYDDTILARLSGQPTGVFQTASAALRPPVAGAPMTDLRELLRFFWTQAELHSRFANVATVLADTRLRGVRVPVITGKQISPQGGWHLPPLPPLTTPPSLRASRLVRKVGGPYHPSVVTGKQISPQGGWHLPPLPELGPGDSFRRTTAPG